MARSLPAKAAVPDAPVSGEPPVPTPEEASLEEKRPEIELSEAFTDVIANIQLQQQQLTALKNSVRGLQKQAVREVKAAIKLSKKGRRKPGNRKPSGFVKPTEISVQLANFLGKKAGTEMARTEVTKEINAYIRAHKLQDPENGRNIIPDKALTKLLKLHKTDKLTYFNLQRYMSPHFAKQATAQA